MRILRRYIGHIVAGSIAIVLLVTVGLDSISELVEQLGDLRADYDFVEVVIFILLSVPSAAYEYLPLSALVGCLLGLGLLAGSSELVVMRAAGVSVFQLVLAVMRPVLLFIVAGVALGEYVAPYADQYADSRRALARGHEQAMQSERGIWNREGNEYMHFNAVLPNGKLFGITRYRFDDKGKLLEASFVDSAIYQGDFWFEQDGKVTSFEGDRLETYTFATRQWNSEVSPDLLNVLVLDADELPMQRLYDYANYLDKQGLVAGEYRLAFWQKAWQPLAVASLVMIAISFILGPLRQTTMGFRVFVGVLVGLVFQTSQKMLGPMSILLGFPPMWAVLIPILVCLLIGLLLIRRA